MLEQVLDCTGCQESSFLIRPPLIHHPFPNSDCGAAYQPRGTYLLLCSACVT